MELPLRQAEEGERTITEKKGAGTEVAAPAPGNYIMPRTFGSQIDIVGQ